MEAVKGQKREPIASAHFGTLTQSSVHPTVTVPLTASMEVKNKYAYVITQDICNKSIEVFFFVGCMISQPNCLLQRSTTMSPINKIGLIFAKSDKI